MLQNKQIYSSFTVLETSCLDCLTEEKNVINLKEGYDAYRGIYALNEASQGYNPD